MTAYYPSAYSQAAPPVVYSQGGYGQPTYAGYGPSAGGMMYVPSHGRSSRRHRHHNYHSAPQIVPSMGPVVMAPSYGYSHPHHYNHYSMGSRFRRFFGLAPSNDVRYKSDRGTWGFMGYSRRQRYIDARTGGEVDRHGRPIYRV
ncbi:hypothetical protein BYT27DRAFT_7221016 [Phlegmacium glaucopus]|nr:hypothetical protein BYT27DRAFT_7221016 [Phlegmacium glaucopus]